MIIQGVAGPQPITDGALATLQTGHDSETVTADFHGRYYTPNYRGRLWTVSNAVAGVAPGTALGTTAPIALWNPTGSKVNLEVIRCAAGYISGTLGAGCMVYAGLAGTTTPTGTRLTSVSGQIGGASSGSVGQGWTGTIATAPTIVRPIGWNMTEFLATSVITPAVWADELAGEFVITPGGIFVIQGIATGGTTPLLCFGISWIESPI
jgi:hypothetical protein